MDANCIAVIGVSPHSIRVVLSARRWVHGTGMQWSDAPIWFDVKGRDAAYRREFECLANWYAFKQSGVNEVSVFENNGVIAR